MPYSFQTGHSYTRREVYRIIGIPEDTHGGIWDTGYARHGNAWFIFCNVGTSGRTGHDYANQWVGNRLEWYGKTNSQLHHPSIKSMLSVDNDTYIFWRENNQQPFIFAGIGNPEEVQNIIPVKIIWIFGTEIFPDEISPSAVFLEGPCVKYQLTPMNVTQLYDKNVLNTTAQVAMSAALTLGKCLGS